MFDLPLALTTGPLTRPCADALAGRRNDVRRYEADGRGGRELETDVRAGRIAAVIDLTLTELAAELLGMPGGAGSDRLTAAALAGVPQLIVPGALDAVAVAGPGRRTVTLDGVTYGRTTPAENDRLGFEIASKASAARGPVAIVLPLSGLSALDREGSPFHWPEANFALFQSLRNWLAPQVRLVEVSAHVNDPAFAAAVLTALDELGR